MENDKKADIGHLSEELNSISLCLISLGDILRNASPDICFDGEAGYGLGELIKKMGKDIKRVRRGLEFCNQD